MHKNLQMSIFFRIFVGFIRVGLRGKRFFAHGLDGLNGLNNEITIRNNYTKWIRIPGLDFC